jgi:hypothetical protein
MRRSHFDLGVVAAWGVLAFGAVVLLSRLSPEPVLAPFDSRHRARLVSTRPHVVLIGNSMVYTRFDSRILNELVSPTRVDVLAIGGSRSVVWYALLKHTVVASGVRPRRVVVFFRGKEIVELERRGGELALAHSIDGHDAIIEEKYGTRAGGRDDGPLAELVPWERLRAASWNRIDALALRFSTALADGPVGERRKKRINRLFGVEALRPEPEEADERADALEDVDERADGSGKSAGDKRKRGHYSIEGSFLPEMFELAKKNDIALTFAHVRMRRHAAGEGDTPGQAKFVRALRAYVEKHGATYLDLTQDEWETLDFYGRGDHTAPHHKRAYTRRFASAHPELFRRDR